ncbi:YIP1 family protein [Maribellus sp. YY47]|uniref:YIP1 family protein n=1 Tax=Maribellus sp. YY47 TaxID=2929486 RepID=UPI002000D633|nr:YIP1 family protein [Maribellus sp. YY47]MCK3685751.1 YIP1 family protein [Maribellus sp. YY47]
MKPIFSIWTKTRQTFQFLEERDEKENERMINILFFLASMFAGFSLAFSVTKTSEINYYLVLPFAFIVSGLMGILMWKFVFAYIVWGVGKIFQGKASIEEIRLALAYSLIPNLVHLVIALVLLVPAIIFDNSELIGYRHPVTIYVLWFFAFRIFVIGLSYFNKYSLVYAFLTAIIPATVIQGLSLLLKYLMH